MNKKIGILLSIIVSSVSFCRLQCLPEFPYQDGWLGADNALSIKLADNKILWIFSDTFVGREGNKDRTHSKIIANTAAISSCNNNSWEIEYFWKNEINDDPQPIFRCPNNKNKFWPTDVFEVNNTLYVALHEVAPKPENADDLFNFSLKATVLAEVKDFRNKTPDKWDVTYIAWPHVFDPNDWNGAMTIEGNYLYVFIGRLRKEYNLVRILKSDLTSPLVSMEYFTGEGSWRHGYDRKNAKVLIEGAAGGSVGYHKKLKKWVMIYGPDFLTSEIHLRCAESITGPWSKSRVIYNVPELLPGERNYSKTNFAYGAREHSAFDEETKGGTLITYDVNSSDFNTLVQSMKIYTPRIIRVDVSKVCPSF
jgi:hypothetical protein